MASCRRGPTGAHGAHYINVVGTRRGLGSRPTVHLNGHFDVVPTGDGWTVDPFGGVVRDGKLYGRGSCDMKAGIAAAVYAVEAIRRTGLALPGTVEVSGTVDEESGGFAGVAWLAEQGRLSPSRTDFCIIPEPLNVDRICVGHRGVYWFEVAARGQIGHGSMPFLGASAIDGMNRFIQLLREDLLPRLSERRTAMRTPVVPEGARVATLNINGIIGGQPVDGIQTPCVADLCRAVFDRRFLLEEGFDQTRREIEDMLAAAGAADPRIEYASRSHGGPPPRTRRMTPLALALCSMRSVMCSDAEPTWWRALAPTITSTLRVSRACLTVSRTVPANSSRRTNRTSSHASTTW
ncbi:MAG: M20/M25/M40 family metallo-hydrolase [Vicinamibacterales bacterium]